MSTLVLPFYFKEIVNYEFSNSDLFSYKLIDWYKEVVFLLSYDLASDYINMRSLEQVNSRWL